MVDGCSRCASSDAPDTRWTRKALARGWMPWRLLLDLTPCRTSPSHSSTTQALRDHTPQESTAHGLETLKNTCAVLCTRFAEVYHIHDSRRGRPHHLVTVRESLNAFPPSDGSTTTRDGSVSLPNHNRNMRRQFSHPSQECHSQHSPKDMSREAEPLFRSACLSAVPHVEFAMCRLSRIQAEVFTASGEHTAYMSLNKDHSTNGKPRIAASSAHLSALTIPP